ncbi:MAG: aspartate carbamoyltransferase regulatory subunit, partial [Candidatus Hodarchaeota archaeon]
VANRLLTPEEISLVALISPNATINSIENYKVVDKYPVKLPETFRGIEGIACPNPNCVTNHEDSVPAEFHLENRGTRPGVRCVYCERHFSPDQVVTPRKRKD